MLLTLRLAWWTWIAQRGIHDEACIRSIRLQYSVLLRCRRYIHIAATLSRHACDKAPGPPGTQHRGRTTDDRPVAALIAACVYKKYFYAAVWLIHTVRSGSCRMTADSNTLPELGLCGKLCGNCNSWPPHSTQVRLYIWVHSVSSSGP